MKTIQILLGSKSPRRQEILAGMGFSFRLVTQDVEESFPQNLEPENVALFLAQKKGESIKNVLKNEHEILLTCDTTVILEGKLYEKPKDQQEAIDMLNKLQGKKHKVVSGVFLQSLHQSLAFSETTWVEFAEMSTAEIQYYVQQYQPMDKAGAYGIQEWLGYNKIKSIEGSFYNVMGLPSASVYQHVINWKF